MSTPAVDSCEHFYTCTGGKFIRFSCPPSLAFDLRTLTCDLKENVECKDNSITENESSEANDSDRWNPVSEVPDRGSEYIKRRNVVIKVSKESVVITITL